MEDNLIATLSRKPPLVSSSQSRAPAPVHTLVAPLKGGGRGGQETVIVWCQGSEKSGCHENYQAVGDQQSPGWQCRYTGTHNKMRIRLTILPGIQSLDRE